MTINYSMTITETFGIIPSMNDTSSKHFDFIHDDYDFFQRHSTEAESDIHAYAPHILQMVKRVNGPIRMLDFGCGDGKATARLFSKVHLPPSRLQLFLVEPDAVYLKNAQERLSLFTENPIKAWGELPNDLSDHFEIIIANNVLYYVTDLKETLSSLIDALASPSIFISSEAGKDNALVRYTFPLFEIAGKPYPFYLADDCIKTLRDLGKSFEVEEVFFDLKFPDSEENRLSMARFLMGQDYPNIPRKDLLQGFDQFFDKGNIDIRTTNKHILLKI